MIELRAAGSAVEKAVRENSKALAGSARMSSLDVTLSADQESAVAAVAAWWTTPSGELKLGGLAGTGKTTIAAVLPAVLGLRPNQVAYCAPTGKAARVLHGKLKAAGSRNVPTTVHRLMYRPQDVHCRDCPAVAGGRCHRLTSARCGCGVAFQKVNALPHSLQLIIVDEASMVDEQMHSDLTSYGRRVVWIGDHGQLPPVRGSALLMSSPDVRLERIHRQAAHSPILRLASNLREYEEISIRYADYEPEVLRVGPDDEVSLEADELGSTLILCHRNETRVAQNTAVRQQLGHPPGRPVPGDRMICLRNNYEAGIVNGLLGTLRTVEGGPATYRVAVDVDDSDVDYVGLVSGRQFGSAALVPDRGVDLWDYGYCLTVHKAQGSEADKVVVIDEYPHWRGKSDERRRWLYTAVTRARKELVIVDEN